MKKIEIDFNLLKKIIKDIKKKRRKFKYELCNYRRTNG